MKRIKRQIKKEVIRGKKANQILQGWREGYLTGKEVDEMITRLLER